ncbi:MAG: acetyl-CoA carboxylase biotin carboxyl carrier protein subunit [Lachnospiraceae bacterium]|nr:acetyl-CoA carboxylase biotin carboxyl carrier protein subunit [Lachnospiraceae bacterium]
MKEYTITVNGTSYDVSVEEKGSSAPSVAAAPKKEASKPSAPLGTEGSIKIEAGAAGKVFKIEKHIGESVKAGENVLILEVMKMETPVVAPEDGVVATLEVQEGQSIEAGALLATMNK